MIAGPVPEQTPARELKAALALGRWAAERMRRDALARSRGAARDHDRVKANPADLVTDTDEAIEQHVRASLAEQFPGHGMLGEEFGARAAQPGQPIWVLDPVDGTTNFAHGLGWSSFSLGLMDDRGPVLGVVVDPWRGEVFSAVRGHGARCNRRRLPRLDASTATGAADGALAGTLVLTEWAGHRPWPGMTALLEQLQHRDVTVRVLGSTALSMVQVAAGRATAAMIGAFHEIDGLPAALIGVEAGAAAVDPAVEGRPDSRIGLPVDGGGLLLAAPQVAAELLDLWRAAVSPVPVTG